MTWARRSSKETAAVVLRLSRGLRIEKPGGLSQKGGCQREWIKMGLNWGKVLALQLPHNSMLTVWETGNILSRLMRRNWVLRCSTLSFDFCLDRKSARLDVCSTQKKHFFLSFSGIIYPNMSPLRDFEMNDMTDKLISLGVLE